MKLDHTPRHRALSIGSVMVDIITVIADEDVELMTLHNMTSSFLMLEQGRKVDAKTIENHIGGGAANTAVAMSRLGLKAGVLALVGDDLTAHKIIERLEAEQVDLGHLIRLDRPGSGTAVHISSHNRNAAIFTRRGVNCDLESGHVAAVDFSRYDLVYITNLSNESADQFPLIVDRAHAAGCFISSNPGIRQLTRRSQDFLGALGAISLLSINKDECAALVPHLVTGGRKPPPAPLPDGSGDLPPLLKDGFTIGGFAMGLVDCMKILAAHGPDYVVITDGGDGAYLLHDDMLHYCPPQKTEMRGTAGAGDCFSATLSSLICAGNPPEVALYAAALNAASVISYIDTQTGLLSFEALAETVAKNSANLTPQEDLRRWRV